MAGSSRANAKSAVIAALAAGLTIEETAKQTPVSARTIHRWLKDAEFKAEVDAARSQLVNNTLGRLSDSATAAVKTLQELLSSSQPPSVRLGAARAILEMAVKYREAVELAERVKQIEATLTMWEAR